MNILADIRDFFFPRLCVVCGTRLKPAESKICLPCMAGLPRTTLGCTPGNKMEQCFWGRFPVERASSLFYYAKDGNVAQILYAMKYHGRKDLCVAMGRLMAEELLLSGFFNGIDGIIPVPLHPSRLRTRGYNQSEQLAMGISAVTHLPVITDAIERARNNVTQTHQGSFSRWLNTEGLFQATESSAQLQGKHILLIDDVLTTGATLTACADALSSVEGIRISILTLAWAK